MEPLTAVVLGALQGVFEWLPVSSEAVISLFMTQVLGSQTVESVNTAIYLHSGTMLAALAYFRDDFFQVLKDVPRCAEEFVETREVPWSYSLLNFLFFSTLVSGAVGGGIYFFGIERLPSDPALFALLVGFALLATGVFKLIGAESDRLAEEAGMRDSVFVGLLQGLAIVPGISRSGSTVFGLFYRDFSSEDAFRLSFLMSVPAIFLAQIGINLFSGFSLTPGLLLATGVAFVVGYVSIDAILGIAERVEVAYLCFAFAALSFLAVAI
ncbi:MAG: undecaprenyl-diphosphate phosphatase [Candidatus Nanohaloarchaea archaeon]